jgi:hypothetical protein
MCFAPPAGTNFNFPQIYAQAEKETSRRQKRTARNKRGMKKKQKDRPMKVAFAAETLLEADAFEVLLRKVAPVCVCE